MGAKHGKTAAQTALRFLIQSGVAVIPKSSRKERMAENFEVFDFVLDAEDLDAIRALDQGESLSSAIMTRNSSSPWPISAIACCSEAKPLRACLRTFGRSEILA